MSKEIKAPTEMTPALRAVADALKTGGVVSAEGIVTFDKGAFESQLGANTSLSLEQAKELQKFNGLFVAATQVAQTELAIPFFKENSDVQMVTSKQQMGLDKLQIRTHHQKTYPIPSQPGEVVTNYCQSSIIHDGYMGPMVREAKQYCGATAKAELLK